VDRPAEFVSEDEIVVDVGSPARIAAIESASGTIAAERRTVLSLSLDHWILDGQISVGVDHHPEGASD
jgi:hypothetical protein